MKPELKKNPEFFVVNATLNYSDDSSHSTEIRFAANQDTTFKEFMIECEKCWQQFRYIYGPEKFDEVTKEKPEEVADLPKED